MEKIISNREGVVAFEAKNGQKKIYINSKPVRAPNGQVEFEEIIPFSNGLKVKMKSGKYSAFLYKTKDWYNFGNGIYQAKQLFIFGDIAAIIKKGLIKNYDY